MPPEIDLEALTAPFPSNAVKQRQGSHGKLLDYLPTHVVINRLNTATGNRWDFEPVSFELKGDTYIFVGKLSVPGLGTRAGIGVQKVVDKSGEDLVKGAASDCLKKCATLFGVGIELYGPDYEAGGIDAAPQARPPAARRPTAVAGDPFAGDGNVPGGASKASLRLLNLLMRRVASEQMVKDYLDVTFRKRSRLDLTQREACAVIEWLTRREADLAEGDDDGALPGMPEEPPATAGSSHFQTH